MTWIVRDDEGIYAWYTARSYKSDSIAAHLMLDRSDPKQNKCLKKRWRKYYRWGFRCVRVEIAYREAGSELWRDWLNRTTLFVANKEVQP
jgi:hypothetical protein